MSFFLLGCLIDRATYEARLAELTDDDGDGYSEVDGDCDDAAADAHPGASERCNERDDDCDGVADEVEDLEGAAWWADADGDGAGGGEAIVTCSPPSGLVAVGGDCDDTDAERFPGAPERCNGLDDDCDGEVDEVAEVETRSWYHDADGDGYGAGGAVASCADPGGYALVAGDCDDTDADRNPGATETCNGADDDCNGAVDDAPAITWYLDRDEDGFGDDETTYVVCSPPPGYARDGGDCDDLDADRNPGAWDDCEDGVDADCDELDPTCGIPTGEADVDDVSTRFTGALGEAYVARTVASAGDLDGDGADELLIARGGWEDFTGKVHVIPGGPDLYLGEIDLDTVGGELRGTAASGVFGFALGSGEDVDGDGTPDVAIVSYGRDEVSLFRGGSGLLSGTLDEADAWATFTSSEGTGTFGVSVALLGDLDGDGFGEVLIGDPEVDGAGAAYVFYGTGTPGAWSASGSVRLSAGELEERAGEHGCSPGDFDGDGMVDMVVTNNLGGGGDAVRGGAFLYLGAGVRLEDGPLASADVVWDGSPTEGLFESCARVGDLDGDGRDDLGFAGTRYPDGWGAVHVVAGTPAAAGGPLLEVADIAWLGESDRPMGASISGAGDLDGDGLDELVVTSTRDSGQAWALVFAGASGLRGTLAASDATLALAGGNSEAEGDALAARVDINGDGAPDLALSAWTGTAFEAWLIYGSR